MKEELEKKIAERFLFMRRKAFNKDDYRSGSLYDRYGLCVGDGWFDIIWSLCEDIETAYKNTGVEIDFVPSQVKEKFGILRFYYDVGAVRKTIHAFDFLGAGTLRSDEKSTPLYQEVHNIVRRWEEASSKICEVCGKPGILRTDLSWALTLCDACHQNRVKERKGGDNE